MRSRIILLGDFEEMSGGDIVGRLRNVETGQRGLLDAFGQHEQQDERRFAEMAQRFDNGLQGVRGDIALLSRAITEAISGDSKTEGLRERVRSVESQLQERVGAIQTQLALREAAMRWMTRMLWTTIAGLVSSVLAGAVLFFATKGGAH